MALILAQARSIPQADAKLRSGIWDRTGLQGVELHGKTLGILGLGRIGSLVAERARAFGMNLVGYDPFVSPEVAKRLGVDMVDEVGALMKSPISSPCICQRHETPKACSMRQPLQR